MKTNKYFKLQIKKALHHYPTILAINIILIVCIAFSCVLIINKNSNSENKQRIKIGIIGDLTDTYLDIGITAVQNMDTSNLYIEFITHKDEKEAKEKLTSGQISGYIRIPEDFVDAIRDMDNIPVSYVTNNSPNGFGSILMNEIAKTISDTVTHTQKGIYGMQKLEKEYDTEQSLGDLTDKINFEYITSILNRTKTFKTKYVGLADGLSTGGYFVCGGIMIFSMLWGISCSSVLIKKDRSLDKLLLSKGQSAFSQVISEYLSFFLITLATFILFACIAGIALQFFKIGIKEIDSSYFFEYIFYVFKIAPVLLMITSLQFLFYEIVSGTVGVVLLQFIYAIGTAYICGCLYPSHYFPISIQKAASLLPTGFGVAYMRQSLSSSPSFSSVFAVFVYTVLFLGLTVLFRIQGNAREKA